MHAGKAALIRILPGLLLMALACPALAQKDAAEKVQEGNVDNWIEYYEKQRAPKSPDASATPPATAPRSAAEAERSAGKVKSGERNSEATTR